MTTITFGRYTLEFGVRPEATSPTVSAPPSDVQYVPDRRSALEALKATRWYIAIGIAWGSLLVGASQSTLWLHAHYGWNWFGLEIVEKLLEHLGAGMFVSALAVFAYEWAAHARHALNLSEKLATILDQRIWPVADAVGRDAITKTLHDYPGSYAIFYPHFVMLADAIVELAAKGDWCKAAYLRFTAHIFGKVAVNAKELKNLSTSLNIDDSATTEYHVDLGARGELAGSILRHEMDLLTELGRYDALSDISSWSYLKEFKEAHERAVVKRGVRIRRLFLLPPDGIKGAAEIVSNHYQNAKDWTARSENNGVYEVRVVTDRTFRSLAPMQSPLLHYGIFRSGLHSQVPIAFQVRDLDLSEFSLRGLGYDDALLRQFEHLWDGQLNQAYRDVVDLLLENEIKHLAKSGSYYAVSDFQSWANGGLKRFHAQCMEDARERHIVVRRIFVVRDGETIQYCRDILDTHARQILPKTHSHGSYSVRVMLERNLPADLAGRWRFGLFLPPGRADDAELLFTETTKSDLSDFIVLRGADDDRGARFGDLWKSSRALKAHNGRVDEVWLSQLINDSKEKT